VRAPYTLGDDVTGNAAVVAVYKLPEHKRHECRLMEGTVVDVSALCGFRVWGLVSEEGACFESSRR